MRLIGFIVILFTINIASAKEQPKLTILSHAFYNSEVDKQVLTGHIENALQHALGEHFLLVPNLTNHARLMKRLSSDEPSCTFNLIKNPERAKTMVFSKIPTYLHVQRRLYALKGTLKSGSAPISVTELLKNKSSFGIIGSTTYRELDDIFADQHYNIATIYGENSFLQLSQLLLTKRIDYIVAYKEAIEAHIPTHELNQLTSRPIAEYPEFIKGFFTCSKTAAGYRAIELINEYMISGKMSAYLKRLHLQINHPDDVKSILNIYKNNYGIHFENSD